MEFIKTGLDGAFVVEQSPMRDERGFFARAWCQREFADAGIHENFVQINASNCLHAGTLRGLHYQDSTAPEAKFLRCVRGSVFDVIVDMREGSPTHGRWFGVELSAQNRKAIYVPPLFAHGYLSLEDEAEVLYQTSAFYEPKAEQGVRFDDPAINIDWPVKIHHLSDKDRAWPDISDHAPRP